MKGLQTVPTIVDALIITLGIDPKGMDDGAKKAKTNMVNIAKFTMGAAIAFKFLKSTVSQFVGAADDIGRFSTRTGIAVGEVQALDNSIKILGGNTGEMRGTIEKLNKQMKGVYAVNPFAAVGVSAVDAQNKIKPMTTILTELAGKMEGMGAAKQADIAERLGLDSSTLMLLQKGKQGVADLFAKQKELGNLTKDDTKVARKMKEAQASLKIAWEASGASIARVLTPAITWFSEKLTDLVVWMRKNETVTKAFFATIATVIMVMVMPALVSMAAGVIAATWPFILIGLAIVAVSAFIAALVDDFIAWKDGGKSSLGDVWKYFQMAFDGMMSIGKTFMSFMSAIWDKIKGPVMDYIEFVKVTFGYIFDIVKAVMSLVVGIFTGDLDKIQTALSNMIGAFKGIWKGYSDYVMNIFSSIGKFIFDKLNGIWKAIKGKFSWALKLVGLGGGEKEDSKEIAREPGAAVRPSSVQNNQKQSSNTQTVTIGTIQTAATNAQELSKDLDTEIKKNTGTVNQADRGMF